jgi:hypothetical protein
MPRARPAKPKMRPEVILALSPTGVATALDIQYDRVRAAIADGVLTPHVIGIKHRILVSEVEAWVRSWPVPAKRKYTKRKVPCPMK